LVLRVIGERPVGELHPAAVTLEFLHEQDLMDRVTREPIRIGDEDAIELGQGGEIPELVEAGTPRPGPGIAAVSEDVIFRELPTAVSDDASQAYAFTADEGMCPVAAAALQVKSCPPQVGCVNPRSGWIGPKSNYPHISHL
jgi:hypothetical protein